MDEKRLQQALERLYAEREYRPSIGIVLYNDEGKYLLVQSAHARTRWNFPQGGIEQGETLEQCIERELAEEVGISKHDVTGMTRCFYMHTLELPNWRRKRGFRRGKAYFYALARYIGDGTLSLATSEIADARWMAYDEAVDHFERGRPEKATLQKKVLRLARCLSSKAGRP